MPKSPLSLVESHWRQLPPGVDSKCPKVACLYCGYVIARVPARMAIHSQKWVRGAQGCRKWPTAPKSLQTSLLSANSIDLTEEQEEQDMDLPQSKRVKRAHQATRAQRSLIQMGVEVTESTQKRELDILAALTCYHANLSFNIWQNDYFKLLLQALKPGYQPPTPWQLGNTLLDDVYHSVKGRVDSIIADQDEVQLVLDESTNINNSRLLNLFIITGRGALFSGLINLGKETASADYLVDVITEQIVRLFGPEFIKKVISFATDTCSTMFKFWRQLAKQEVFSHCLFIPCDSHGIQLLMNDILALPECQVLLEAHRIAVYFKRTPKQHQILREHQITHYRKAKALILSVITRWGTYFGVVNRVIDLRQALHSWSIDPAAVKTRKAKNIKGIIKREDFWHKLERLHELLKPLHEAQLESEREDAHLGLVKRRWIMIKAQFYD